LSLSCHNVPFSSCCSQSYAQAVWIKTEVVDLPGFTLKRVMHWLF
jgi:hypothetical protein